MARTHARRRGCPPKPRSWTSSASAARWCARPCRKLQADRRRCARATAWAPSSSAHPTPARAVSHRARATWQTLRDVIAVLELRIGIETEAAALAAQRRSDDSHLKSMRRRARRLQRARCEAGRDAVEADLRFHLRDRARHAATRISAELDGHARRFKIIPRARLGPPTTLTRPASAAPTCAASTPSTRACYDAIATVQDAEGRTRGDAHAPRQQQGAPDAGPGPRRGTRLCRAHAGLDTTQAGCTMTCHSRRI